MLWTNKYAPKNIKEVFHPSVVKIVEFIVNFKNQKKKGLLIHGPTGTGKTSVIHAIAKEKDLELIEVNASDFRNADMINEKVGNAIKQMSLFAKKKLILVDEIDGLAGSKDRGGVSALTALIKKTSFPVICTANNVWDSKLSSLRKVCSLLSWDCPNYISIANFLEKLLKKEKISVDKDIIKSIARRSGGDVRAAITDVQVLATSLKLNADGVDSVDARAQTETMFNALIKILKASDPLVALSALDSVEEDFNQSMLWIEENIPLEYKNEELVSAFDKLSRADVFLGRIRRWQYWRFMVYAQALITAGVAVSKSGPKRGFTKYQPPKRILKYWMAKQKKALRRSVSQKFSHVLHCSEKKTNELIPYLRLFSEKGVDLSNLDLSGEELEWLKKK